MQRGGRRLVVGDVHGCAQTLAALLRNVVRVTPRDHVYFLGDLVNKGPDSLGVLQHVVMLMRGGIRVTLLRGNHEHSLLQADRKGRAAPLAKRGGSQALLAGKQLAPKWRDLFERMLYFVALPDVLLVHAGFRFDSDAPFFDRDAMLNSKALVYDETATAGRTIIHGHVRHPLSAIVRAVTQRASVVPLENGAVLGLGRHDYSIHESGNLCCLDLDSRELHVQPAIEDRDDVMPGCTFYCDRIT